jgi:hypothetical protein
MESAVPNHPVQAPPKKSVNMVFVIVLTLGVALLLSAVVYLFVRSPKTGSSNQQTSSLTPSQNSVDTTKQVAVHTDGDLTFSYDASWKKISSHALLKLQFENEEPAKAVDITYFFSPYNWKMAREQLTYLKQDVGVDPVSGNLPLAAMVDVLIPIMDADVHRRANISARDFALESTKGICKGRILASYDKSSAPDPTKIKEIVVAGKKAYMELPQSTCDYKFTSIFFDATKKNAEGKMDSYQIIFNNAKNLEDLSPEQQIILNSIKLQ